MLNRQWDPIGIYPDREDEYDTYAMRATRLLLQNADAARVAALLTDAARRSMGFEDANEPQVIPIAEQLVRLAKELKADN